MDSFSGVDHSLPFIWHLMHCITSSQGAIFQLEYLQCNLSVHVYRAKKNTLYDNSLEWDFTL